MKASYLAALTACEQSLVLVIDVIMLSCKVIKTLLDGV